MTAPTTGAGRLRRRLACWLAGGNNYVADGEQYRTLVQHHIALSAHADALLAMHRPWLEVQGVRHDHTVYIGDDERPADHVCRVGTALDACGPEEHYVLACVECRATTEDGDAGSLLWPCPTARLALAL